MNKLLDAAETAASGRRQQWLWYRKPKAAVALATMATATLHSVTIERQCGTTKREQEEGKHESFIESMLIKSSLLIFFFLSICL
jgi:hypothetical protein